VDNVSIAYKRGYDAVNGSSSSRIIINFGRQLEPGRQPEGADYTLTDWAVQLPRDFRVDVEPLDRVKSREWVKEVAKAFIRGYNDNITHTYTIIAIGTQNSNYAWECGEDTASDLWEDAGREWRDLVQEIENEMNNELGKITLVGAIDMESWVGDFPDWAACDDGMTKWFYGWEEQISGSTKLMINFGSVAFTANNLWSEAKLYSFFMGKRYILAYPQVYCVSYVRDLRNLVSDFVTSNRNNIYFSGVTSENAGSLVCGNTRSYTWQQSWRELNSSLNTIPGINSIVGRTAISFYLPPIDADMP
jgi:hypothetical protein